MADKRDRREPQFLHARPSETGAAVPLPYEVWGDGVYKLDGEKAPDGAPPVVPDMDQRPPAAHRKCLERIALKPLWVCDTGVTDGTMPEAVVELAWTMGDEVQTRWVGMADISDVRRLIDLSKFGVPSSSENAHELVAYLTRCARLVSMTRSGSLLVSRCGWRVMKDGPGYMLGDVWHGPGRVVADPRRGTTEFMQALKPAGDPAVWCDWARKVFGESWAARFTLSAAAAVPLLHMQVLGEPSFYLHHWGQSKRGKSALVRFAMSFWGKPTILAGTFHRTLNSVTEMFRHVTDMPTSLDELQVANDLDTAHVIYAICIERSKERALRGGGLAPGQESWKTAVMMTGEKAVVERDLGGQTNRGFQFNVPIFDKLVDGAVLYAASNWNYGHGAAILIPHLVQQLNDDAGYAVRLRQAHEAVAHRLRAAVPRVNEHHAKMAATVVLGGWLLAEVVLGLGKDERPRIFQDAVQALDEGTSVADGDLVLQALDAIREHRMSSGGAWVDGRLTPYEMKRRMANVHNLMGIVARYANRDEVWLAKTQADRLIKSLGLPPGRVWSDLAAAKVLLRDGRNLAVKRPFGTDRIRVYVIPYEALYPSLPSEGAYLHLVKDDVVPVEPEKEPDPTDPTAS